MTCTDAPATRFLVTVIRSEFVTYEVEASHPDDAWEVAWDAAHQGARPAHAELRQIEGATTYSLIEQADAPAPGDTSRLIELAAYDLSIEVDGGGARLVSSALGEGFDQLESMLVAMAAAGLDLDTPEVLEAIEACVGACTAHQPDWAHDAVLNTASGDFRIDLIDAWREAPTGASHTTELLIAQAWVPVYTDDGHEALAEYLTAIASARQDAERARTSARLAATLGADGVAALLRQVLFRLDYDDVSRVSDALARGLEKTGTWARRAWIQAACKAGADWPDLIGEAYTRTLEEAEDPNACPGCGATSSDEDEPILEVYALAQDDLGGECTNMVYLCSCTRCRTTFRYVGDLY